MLNYFNIINRLDRKRKKLQQRLPQHLQGSAMAHYLSQPMPSPELPVNQISMLSVDFETTGLNAVLDKLLSIGCVEINNGRIQLATTWHQIIDVAQPLVAENIAIHQITDSETNLGCTLKEAIDTLLMKMAGKVLLVHYAAIERRFLNQACWQLYGVKPPFLIIDTLALAKQRLDMADAGYDPSRLRLANLMAEYELPVYSTHNALYDAITTAELLLAELQHHKNGLDTKLNRLF